MILFLTKGKFLLPSEESIDLSLNVRVYSVDLNNGQGHSKTRQDSKGLYLKEARCSLVLQLGGSKWFEFGTIKRAIQIPDKIVQFSNGCVVWILAVFNSSY